MPEHATKAKRSGDLAEAAVKSRFGLVEPMVEVKAASKRNWHCVIGLAQLERSMDRPYVVVVYDRAIKKTARKRTTHQRKHPRPDKLIEAAFKGPLEFIFVTALDMLKAVLASKHQIRAIVSKREAAAKFYAYVSLKLLRDMTHDSETFEDGTVVRGANCFDGQSLPQVDGEPPF